MAELPCVMNTSGLGAKWALFAHFDPLHPAQRNTSMAHRDYDRHVRVIGLNTRTNCLHLCTITIASMFMADCQYYINEIMPRCSVELRTDISPECIICKTIGEANIDHFLQDWDKLITSTTIARSKTKCVSVNVIIRTRINCIVF